MLGDDPRLTPSKNTHYCPKCGWETPGLDGIVVFIPGMEATHCAKCFAEWLRMNIPIIIPKKETP